MTHPLIEYWKLAFDQYRTGPMSFSCTEMPDPILSPNFVGSLNQVEGLDHLNLIQDLSQGLPDEPAGFHLRNRFFLAQLEVREQSANFAHRIEPLLRASSSDEHQRLLLDGFPKDYDFLLRLEKFLPTLNAKYCVGTVLDEISGECIASVTMGVAGSFAVLLSGVVQSQFRNKGVSRKLETLTHFMASGFGAKHAFYWTHSERLIRYADSVDRYLIYVRS